MQFEETQSQFPFMVSEVDQIYFGIESLASGPSARSQELKLHNFNELISIHRATFFILPLLQEA